jgi:hypothetical protein
MQLGHSLMDYDLHVLPRVRSERLHALLIVIESPGGDGYVDGLSRQFFDTPVIPAPGAQPRCLGSPAHHTGCRSPCGLVSLQRGYALSQRCLAGTLFLRSPLVPQRGESRLVPPHIAHLCVDLAARHRTGSPASRGHLLRDS